MSQIHRKTPGLITGETPWKQNNSTFCLPSPPAQVTWWWHTSDYTPMTTWPQPLASLSEDTLSSQQFHLPARHRGGGQSPGPSTSWAGTLDQPDSVDTSSRHSSQASLCSHRSIPPTIVSKLTRPGPPTLGASALPGVTLALWCPQNASHQVCPSLACQCLLQAYLSSGPVNPAPKTFRLPHPTRATAWSRSI